MTHSDYFKPQGIATSMNIAYDNVPASIQIAHRAKLTGSSRYWNIMDWDGSASSYPFGVGNPVVIGGTDSMVYSSTNGDIVIQDWWKISDSCIRNDQWQTYLCQKTHDIEIGYLTFTLDGIVGWWNGARWNEQNPYKYIGRTFFLNCGKAVGLTSVSSFFRTDVPVRSPRNLAS